MPERIATLGLGIALAYGALAQGAFYAGQLTTVLVAVAIAAAARLAAVPRAEPIISVAAGSWLLFAVWVVVLGYAGGSVEAAVPAAAMATCLAAAAWSAHDLPAPSRAVLHVVALSTALAVAASGWLGAALHVEPFALPSYGLWRASSTITYANATAAFLVMALFLAVAVLPAHRRLLSQLVVAALLLGALTTLSRAGFLALLTGALALLCATPNRRRLLQYWPALPAVAVAFAGLLPSLPEQSQARPDLALAGLAGGVVVLVAAGHRRLRILVGAALGLALAAVLVLMPPATDALGSITATRLTATSAERDDLARITAEQFLSAPLTGVGPGRLDFTYMDHTGQLVRAQYTHDEYLQTAAETGVIGLALVLTGLGALAVGALRRRPVMQPGRAAPDADGGRSSATPAALAIIVAFAVHSAFDFLWHIAVVPLLLVLSVVTLLPDAGRPSARTTPEVSP